VDPRIYRTGFVTVALAVVLLAFSLSDQPGPLTTTLAPDAFNGQNAYATMQRLAKQYPNRLPGSAGDDALAGVVAQSLQSRGFAVSTSSVSGRTAVGTRVLETVTGTRTGESSGTIVVVANRDALTAPATAQLSGTATLLEMARVLAGETQHRTIVLASTSGSAGGAGARALARSIPGPVDAVIALGDLAGTVTRDPVVVPWSDGPSVAPPSLRNTLATTVATQAGIRPGGASLASQLARLSFPLTLSDQGPFGARGQPAVLLSFSGERGPAANETASFDRINGAGRAVLQAVSALDGGPGIPAASPYLLYDGKVIPAWAVRLLLLGLIAPVLGATIDALARARRRGYPIVPGVATVLATAAPFVLALIVVLVARLTGIIKAAPPEPVGQGVVPLHGGGVAVLVGVAAVLAISFWARHRMRSTASDASGVAILIVMCVTSLLIWVSNPFAAALVVPALHLWIWVVDPEVPLGRAAKLSLLVVGLTPPALVIAYYTATLALGPGGIVWNGLLLIAGGHISALAGIEWSVLLGCTILVATRAVRPSRAEREEVGVTVRGPITYAGPGSLGGTESALRR
jgi:hypothetical protein